MYDCLLRLTQERGHTNCATMMEKSGIDAGVKGEGGEGGGREREGGGELETFVFQ